MSIIPDPVIVDNLDGYVARKVFGLHGNAPDEQLCRRVLAYTGTGVDYSDLSLVDKVACCSWAVALGSFPPGGVDLWCQPRAVAVGDDEAKLASYAVAHLVCSNGTADSLAAALLPSRRDRRPAVVLAALGVRVYRGAMNVVQHHDDADHSDEYERPRDRYDDMAELVPETDDIDDGRDARASYEHYVFCGCERCEERRQFLFDNPHLF